MRVLVAGGARVDAGKTTFSVGLIERTGAVGFKPRAGNDFWFDHDDVRHAVARDRLFGKDARRLAAASPGTLDPEMVNPVHRLWRPSPAGGSGLLGKDDREFLVDRIGRGGGNGLGRGDGNRVNPNDRSGGGVDYVVNDTVEIPEEVREALPLGDAPRVASLDRFNDLMADRHLPAQRALVEDIAAADRAVVESYADVARPVQGVEPDAVAVVEPGRVRVYDGRRWAKACEVASGGPEVGQLEERVPTVVDLVDAAATVDLPALSGDEQTDPAAVADAYQGAYDRVLATVEE